VTSSFFSPLACPLAAAAAVVSLLAGAPASAQSVPSEFQAVYSELETRLDSFSSQLQAMPVSATRPRYVAQLSIANSNRGASLLNQYSYYGILMELDRLKALGVDAITVSVSFPLLSTRYHATQSELQTWMGFYRWVADSIRARGLTVIVEDGIAMPQADIRAHYQSLTFESYVVGRVESVMRVAAAMRPDYLAIGAEPDKEAEFTGQPVNDVATSTAIVNAIVGNVRKLGLSGIRIGAGVGTWQAGHDEFVRSYCQNTALDFIDLHVFPINFDFLDRALDLADLAMSYGKRVGITQAWLYKATEAELIDSVPYQQIADRDVYAFWAPLDAKFIEMLVRLARVKGLDFVTPLWSRHYFAYLDYAQVRGWTTEQLATQILGVSVQNMIDGRYTVTAQRFSAAIEAARGAAAVPGR
jgi:hypothetical protein